MAGVKGMKGGGGARPGAGRKPEPEVIVEHIDEKDDPKAFLLNMMNDSAIDVKLRLDAAKTLMPFFHVKLGEGGKREAKETAAKKAGAGKFSAAPPPLKVVNSR